MQTEPGRRDRDRIGAWGGERGRAQAGVCRQPSTTGTEIQSGPLDAAGAGIQEEDLGLGYQPGTRDKGATHCPRLPELIQGMRDPERMSKAEPWDPPGGEGSGR